jgi:transposase
MQAATAATIEYTDYPECERRIYPTENDIAFYKTYEFCEAEGALQVYSKPEGVGHKLSAIRQFAPNSIMPELHSIFTKTSEKSNRLTYYNCTTNLYITNNTAYWAKSLRESGIRTDSRISQLISLGFDIDCHEEGVPLYYSDGICKMLTTAIYNGALPEGFVVNTGRGAAYWIFIDPVNPNNKHALKIYKRLHTKIRTMLKAEIVNWGDNYLYASVDDSVKGINHIMRLPGTFNTKAGRCCHVYHAPAVGYRLNDLYVLADSIDVEWRIVDDTVVSNREIFNTTDEQELAWAKKRFAKRILEWNTERSVVSARSIARPRSEIAERCITQRWDAVIDFLRRNTTPVGKRHTVLLYCLSTACDYHQAASFEKAQLINSTFAEPLPDKEVAKIVSWVKHPFKDETIAEALGLTKEEFKNLRINTFKKKMDRSRQIHDGILYPVASSAADRKMLGVLIDHKVIPDYRIRNHRKIWEAAQKREAKKAMYDTIIELFDKEKLSIKQIAKKLEIGIDTVKRQAAIRGVDIVDEEKKRRMRRTLEMQALSGEGWSVKAIAELFKCHVATVYRALQEVIEQTAEELERSIRAAADRVVEHTNELKVKAVEAVEQMKNPFLPVLEKAELRLNLYARQKTIDRITKPFQDAGYLPATLALPRKQVVEGSNLSVAVRLGSDYQSVCSMDELLLDESRPKRVDYSKADLWLAEPDDNPEDFETDFPDDAAFQMSAECLGEYDDEVSSRW